ncbi:hypothetical protein OEZ85_000604 [Tetradesmus obliquus]|uniref:N-acetyltransferase domain-containing protein n=1 Tax=Tetradesmus obliquus TaxID=3088 RepID=A0ABY8UIM4_TETOB|nr:hypothetical protein OEZ85_000604 [Tetradesmus obliquus]
MIVAAVALPSAACSRPVLKPCRTRLKVVACAAPAAVKEAVIPAGKVTVGFLQANDVQGAGLLLTRAFAGTPEAVKLDEAVKFMQLHINDEQECTLVAKLLPTDPALLPPGKSARLVGVVSLSFSAAGREDFCSLAPPADQPYLSNMAVDPKFRRQGIARAMLEACDSAAQGRAQDTIWLHVRQADEAAQQLYTNYGYSEVVRDPASAPGVFGLLLGGGGAQAVRPRILMKRQVAQ